MKIQIIIELPIEVDQLPIQIKEAERLLELTGFKQKHSFLQVTADGKGVIIEGVNP